MGPSAKKRNKLAVRQKKVAVKTTLCSPYDVTWPRLSPEVEQQVLDILLEGITAVDLKRPVVAKQLPKEKRTESLQEAWKLVTEEQKNLRSQLRLGVTSVTRALEGGWLRLVVVERSAPPMLHRHLVQLAAVRRCPAVAVAGVSALLAPQLSLDSFVAVGFKCRESTDQPAFDDLVAKVTSLAPTIDLPWLSFERSLASDDAGESPPAAGDPEGESPERGGRESSPEVDYSYLYIYKHDSGASGDAKPLAESGTKPGVKLDAAETFIALASSADESDSDQGEGARRDVGRGGKRGGGRGRGLKRYMDRTTVPDRGTQKATNRPKYLTANVKQVYQNVNRKEFSGKHANKNVVLVDYK